MPVSGRAGGEMGWGAGGGQVWGCAGDVRRGCYMGNGVHDVGGP